jgi:hypothetical protein
MRSLAIVDIENEYFDSAAALLFDSIVIEQEMSDTRCIADCIDIFAWMAIRRNKLGVAGQLLSAADGQRRNKEIPTAPWISDLREETIARIQEAQLLNPTDSAMVNWNLGQITEFIRHNLFHL